MSESGAILPAEGVRRASDRDNDRAERVIDVQDDTIDGNGPKCPATDPNWREDAVETQQPPSDNDNFIVILK